ncbi:MAG: GNAT family N-acetyltransferase [Pseudomonadota bacterium]
MTPDADQLMQVCDATWPAARRWRQGPFELRDGQGGGKRVSAAIAVAPDAPNQIDAAEAAMRAQGQRPLFQPRAGDADLDDALAARGYAKVDPTYLRVGKVAALTDIPIPPVTAFSIWEPLAIMQEIWAKGGIDASRLDVMARVPVKTGILARWNEKPAGAAFAGLEGDVVMVHALEVLPHQRRMGVAQWMMRKAAFWGAAQGAQHIAVLVTEANAGANALYDALGLARVGGYHYRQHPEET